MDEPYYVGYRVGGQEVGLVPTSTQPEAAKPVAYIDVVDIEVSLAALVKAGGKVHQEIKNVGGSRRVASVVDASGNELGLR